MCQGAGGTQVLLQVSQGEDQEVVKAPVDLVGDLDKARQFEWGESPYGEA